MYFLFIQNKTIRETVKFEFKKMYIFVETVDHEKNIFTINSTYIFC